MNKKDIDEIIKKIESYDNIFIYRHINPDGDAYGSQFGLKTWIELNFKNKNVYAIAIDDSEYLNKIFPTLISDEEKEELIKNSLVIVVDTANSKRISGIHWNKGAEVIKIDHHPKIEEYSDIEMIYSDRTSCSEIIVDLIRKSKTKINAIGCKYLATGMITDTGRFVYPGVDEKTINNFSWLLKSKELNLSEIYNIIYYKDTKSIKFNAYVMSNYKIKGNIGYIILKKNIENNFKLNYEQVSSAVNLIMQDYSIDYAIFLSWNNKDKIWKGSLRSRKEPINKVANLFNGGGHKMASGFSLKDKKEIKNVILELEKLS